MASKFHRPSKTAYSQQYLHAYLRLLGYQEDKRVKVLENPKVFEHPGHREFIYVMRFLLGLIEESEETFQNCFPPLDKKQEAEFRRKAFASYKKIQSDNLEQLIPVTASLFLTPGGNKFIHFLMTFLRWITLRHLREEAQEKSPILGLAFIQSENMHSKTKEIFLKRQAKEFKARALEVNKSSKEILVKGKSLIEEMESKWRRASVNPVHEQSPLEEEEESPPIVVVEAEVIAKANRINDIVGRLSRDMDIISIFREKRIKDPMNLSVPSTQKSLRAIVKSMYSEQLSSVYHPDALMNNDLSGLSNIVSNMLSQAERLSLRLLQELLHLNKGLIPSKNEEINAVVESLKTSSTESTFKCLLPPTPSLDIKAASSSLYHRNNYSSSCNITPISRLRDSKKTSPIHFKPPESLEDSSVHSLSHLSPMMSSSRVMTSTLGTSTVSDTVCSEVTSKVSTVLERFRNLKLQKSAPSSNNSHHSEGSFEPICSSPHSKKTYLKSPLSTQHSPVVRGYTPSSRFPNLDSPLDKLDSSSLSCNGSEFRAHTKSPIYLEKNKRRDSEAYIGSRLEELIQSLGGGNSEDIRSLSDEIEELPLFDL